MQVALAHKILGKAVVGGADGEDHLLLMLRLAVLGRIPCPDLLCHAEGGPGLGPTGVKGGVGEDLRDLFPGDAVLPGRGQVVLEGAVHQPLRHEGDHGDQGAVPQGQLILPAPHLAEEHIVIQLSELGSKLPQSVSARGLFHCHIKYLLCKRKCDLHSSVAQLLL